MPLFNNLVRAATVLGAISGVFGIFSVYKLQAEITGSSEPGKPPITPPTKPYAKTVAGTGIFESWGENVVIGVPAPGLVKEVTVAVNDVVKAGQPLLKLDDQEVQAALVNARATVGAAEADVAVARATLDKTQDFVKRLAALRDNRSVSQDEVATREFEQQIAQAQLTASQSRLTKATADVQSHTLLLERLTVKAPRDGSILQVNVRAGEYASTQGNGKSLMVLGDLSKLQVRVDIDEQNATRIQPGMKAICYVKEFVRIEPYIIPKASLTGASTERVDTRVLQMIYRYQPQPKTATFVGQQVDVFIQAE
jgi:HlyD family secretion protein